MKPGYIIKHWLKMDFVFPHWSLYWMFWVSLVTSPIPVMMLAHHSGPISYKTGYALSVYILFIFSLLYMLAAFIGYKYTHIHGGGVKNYQHKRNKIIAAALPIAAATLYFTGYLITIPFGHAPNYTFTLKPSPQLEMELNHLLGDDTIEYTPFDYSLEEQEITYVTNGVDSMDLDMISRLVHTPLEIVLLDEEDLRYTQSINKQEPFILKAIEGVCYLSAKVDAFKPRTIPHSKFKTPIIVKTGQNAEMLIDATGAFYAENNTCQDVYPYGSKESDLVKEKALEAYFQYPYIYQDISKIELNHRATLSMSLYDFDDQISNF